MQAAEIRDLPLRRRRFKSPAVEPAARRRETTRAATAVTKSMTWDALSRVMTTAAQRVAGRGRKLFPGAPLLDEDKSRIQALR